MQSKGALTHIYTWVLAFLHIAKQCHQFSKILTIIRFSIYKIDEIPYKYIAYFISIIFLAALFNFKIQILFGGHFVCFSAKGNNLFKFNLFSKLR